MATLDGFMPHLGSQDTKKKLQIGQQVLDYLRNKENSLECEALNVFIDSIMAWLHNSNFKVAQYGLEILAQLAERMHEDFRPYLSSTIGPTIDRLGDPKDVVREAAKALFTCLMNNVSTPQNILERLMPAFVHKSWRVREEVCTFLQECLLRYGVVGPTNGQLLVGKFVPSLVALMSDQTSQVREASMATLLAIYKHVGERLREEIMKKHSNMPAQKYQTLLMKFQEIATTGEVTSGPTSLGVINGGSNGYKTAAKAARHDEVDFKRSPALSAASKRATSAPPVKRREDARGGVAPPVATKPQHLGRTGPAGAADEQMFMNSFEDVDRVSIFSGKNVEDEMKKICEVLSDSAKDWEERVRKLRVLRALLIEGAASYDEFYAQLKFLDVPFQTSVKDLRSQVVREACISIAYLSQTIGNRCDRFAELLLPVLIIQIQNSAKIISTSAMVAIRFIISYTHAPKLIPKITCHVTSRSREIRSACYEFLALLLQMWPAKLLRPHVGLLQEAIKKGLSDSDTQEARKFALKAFGGFADKFKADADQLLASLDSGRQKMLAGEVMSNWGSANSLNKMSTGVRPPPTMRMASSSTNGSMESVTAAQHYRGVLAYKKSAIPVCSPVATTNSPAAHFGSPLRATNSAIDVDAQRRAREKANSYRSYQQTTPRSMYTPSRPTSTLRSQPPRRRAFDTVSNDERASPRQPRTVSKSQPGSRSQSPNSRLAYYSSGRTPTTATTTTTTTPRTRRTSMTSRDASPARSTTTARSAYERRVSSSSVRSSGGSRGSNRVSVSSENLLDTAFMMHPIPRRKTYDGESDDASETSSICSEHSFGGMADMGPVVEDVSRILDLLSSQQLTERNIGLRALKRFMEMRDRTLNQFELKRVTDIFTRMLVDPHTKVFSFLPILNDLIQNYKHELSSWLYIIMTRLFLKAGSDTLGSVQTRILKTLELIRESFTNRAQFDVIMRLLSDPSQTLSPKVKIVILQYLSKLIFVIDSVDFIYNQDNRREIETALMKIVSWTADIKSPELRRLAQETIVDLYTLNSVDMLQYINALPKTHQDAAQQIIQHKRKTRSSVTLTPTQPAAGMMQTPFKVKTLYNNGAAGGGGNFFDESPPFNPAEIYDSLKKTSDEIQKYSFSTSFDSTTTTAIDGQQQPCNGKVVANGHTAAEQAKPEVAPAAPPTQRLDLDGTLDNVSFSAASLTDAIYYVQASTPNEVATTAVRLYGRLLAHYEAGSGDKPTKLAILRLIGQMLLKHAFEEEMERTLRLLVLVASHDGDKDVMKTAEETGQIAGAVFDAHKLFTFLGELINCEDSVTSIATIKILNRMAEVGDKTTMLELLPRLIPPLLQAFDSDESAVRKATVFCIVALYGSVREQLYEHLKPLNTSKRKLVELYINRFEQNAAAAKE